MNTYFTKIHVGVLFDQDISSGGGYQQAVNAVLNLRNIYYKELVIKYFVFNVESLNTLKELNISAVLIPKFSFFIKAIFKLKKHFQFQLPKYIFRKIIWDSPLESFLKKHEIELVYFTSPSSNAMNFNSLNFIYTVWDLCHRDYPEFPEVRSMGEFERREELYKSTLPKATAIIVDSNLGKYNVSHRYQIDSNRIYVIPFTKAPSTNITEKEYQLGYIDISSKYNLKHPYIFYPAQFWPHKNHVYILKAIRILKDKYGIEIIALFSGGDKGNLEHVKCTAEILNITNNVKFLGFVENQEIPYLYRQSLALVMPTYFGPTNLPPLEAFSLGTPVIYSDLNGLKDQVNEAAVLIDLQNPSSLSGAILNLFDADFRNAYINLGYDLVKKNKLHESVGQFYKIFKSFHIIKNSWR